MFTLLRGFLRADSFDDYGGEIIFLLRSVRERQHRLIQLGDNFFRRQIAKLSHLVAQPVETKLLVGGIRPLKKTVCDKQDQIARLKVKDHRSIRGQYLLDAQRQCLRSKLLKVAGLRDKNEQRP